jgi:hypothetical protein
VSEFVRIVPPRRNRRFFSFHRPQRRRGCGAVLETGSAGEHRVSRARDAYRVRNRFATGLSSGRSEGLNGKIRTITRRSLGFHSATSLIALITLCCGGIVLSPVLR